MPVRKTAPSIKVGGGGWVDTRSQVAIGLDEQNPDFVHVWQEGDITLDELKRKGLELVEDSDGSKVHDGPDVLCRQPRKTYEAIRQAESDESEKFVMKLAGGNVRKVRKFADPVVPHKKERE